MRRPNEAPWILEYGGDSRLDETITERVNAYARLLQRFGHEYWY